MGDSDEVKAMPQRAKGFVINLAASPQRFDSAKAELDDVQIDTIRVDAFDGREIDLAQYAPYDDRKARQFMGRSMTQGEVGCYVSHQRAATAFLESGDDIGFVFEDDIALKPEFKTAAAALIEWLRPRDDWHCVNLGATRLKITTPMAEVAGVSILRAHYFPMLAHALIWNRAGAAAFLAAAEPIFCPADNMLRQVLTRSDMGLATGQSLVTAGQFDSDISARSAGNRGQFRRSPLYGLRKQRRLLHEKAMAVAHRLGHR
ncbi:glycosyltransferase family 25 protein [Sulfitobacter sp. S0837]|uniref:glycosyltransferase family 25 protein n=1 Tax=Sulfitobacter maritimus TaxID=2741719 RepID=UPI001581C349|nr:glycosyltransferase family 25 protein [Sulfitobacter maritimus]NUH65372.1 glycosyltransferase family 25 protein [Sulfitobacter maritimus]